MKSQSVLMLLHRFLSPPSRRRGLKFSYSLNLILKLLVASFSEAWIEISYIMDWDYEKYVASFSEAWIEMRRVACVCRKLWSPPSRRRGLKFPGKVEDLPDEKVASFSEAWIEIQSRS